MLITIMLKKVWEDFEIKNLGEYQYIYVQGKIHYYSQSYLYLTFLVPQKVTTITKCPLFRSFGFFWQKKTTEIKMEDFCFKV